MRPFVSLLTLGVADVERSRRFYEEGLGWRVTRSQDDWVCFDLGDGASALALWPREKLAQDAAAHGTGGEFGGVTLAYNTTSRERVDELLAEAERAGGRIVKPAEDAFWGGYSGYFADPDGYPWEVAWNPFFHAI